MDNNDLTIPPAPIRMSRTSEAIPEMTAQEVFDTAARHLFAQGHPARGVAGTCALRGADGIDKCAVGVFIPDSVYVPCMEHIGNIHYLIESFPKLTPLMPHRLMLGLLQGLHDNPGNWRSTIAMRTALNNAARCLQLDPGVPLGLSFVSDPQPPVL